MKISRPAGMSLIFIGPESQCPLGGSLLPLTAFSATATFLATSDVKSSVTWTRGLLSGVVEVKMSAVCLSEGLEVLLPLLLLLVLRLKVECVCVCVCATQRPPPPLRVLQFLTLCLFCVSLCVAPHGPQPCLHPATLPPTSNPLGLQSGLTGPLVCRNKHNKDDEVSVYLCSRHFQDEQENAKTNDNNHLWPQHQHHEYLRADRWCLPP